MENSWPTIYKTLKRAKVVLEEVLTVMTDNPDKTTAKENVKDACQAINELITEKDKEIQEASANIQYQNLVKKLKAQNLSFTEEEWDDA